MVWLTQFQRAYTVHLQQVMKKLNVKIIIIYTTINSNTSECVAPLIAVTHKKPFTTSWTHRVKQNVTE